jgi:hypothetical protein
MGISKSFNKFGYGLILILLLSTSAAAVTINSDTTWSATTHILTDNITITNNATLTIASGATIKFNDDVFYGCRTGL